MIPRRKNPDAPYRYQWRLPDGTWTHDLESAEWAWRELERAEAS